jgi:hypothetical protein
MYPIVPKSGLLPISSAMPLSSAGGTSSATISSSTTSTPFLWVVRRNFLQMDESSQYAAVKWLVQSCNQRDLDAAKIAKRTKLPLSVADKISVQLNQEFVSTAGAPDSAFGHAVAPKLSLSASMGSFIQRFLDVLPDNGLAIDQIAAQFGDLAQPAVAAAVESCHAIARDGVVYPWNSCNGDNEFMEEIIPPFPHEVSVEFAEMAQGDGIPLEEEALDRILADAGPQALANFGMALPATLHDFDRALQMPFDLSASQQPSFLLTRSLSFDQRPHSSQGVFPAFPETP